MPLATQHELTELSQHIVSARLHRAGQGASLAQSKLPGTAKQVKGSLTEALGKLTGDKVTEAKGAAKKLEGEAEVKASKNKTGKKK
ncbi:MAG: CsbD family protein [Janthinobacterium lividum]